MTTLHPFRRAMGTKRLYGKPHLFQVGGRWYRIEAPTDEPPRHNRWSDSGRWCRKMNDGKVPRSWIELSDAPARTAIAKHATRHHR